MKVRCINLVYGQGLQGVTVGSTYCVTHIYPGGSVDIIDDDEESNMLFSQEYEVVEE